MSGNLTKRQVLSHHRLKRDRDDDDDDDENLVNRQVTKDLKKTFSNWSLFIINTNNKDYTNPVAHVRLFPSSRIDVDTGELTNQPVNIREQNYTSLKVKQKSIDPVSGNSLYLKNDSGFDTILTMVTNGESLSVHWANYMIVQFNPVTHDAESVQPPVEYTNVAIFQYQQFVLVFIKLDDKIPNFVDVSWILKSCENLRLAPYWSVTYNNISLRLPTNPVGGEVIIGRSPIAYIGSEFFATDGRINFNYDKTPDEVYDHVKLSWSNKFPKKLVVRDIGSGLGTLVEGYRHRNNRKYADTENNIANDDNVDDNDDIGNGRFSILLSAPIDPNKSATAEQIKKAAMTFERDKITRSTAAEISISAQPFMRWFINLSKDHKLELSYHHGFNPLGDGKLVVGFDEKLDPAVRIYSNQCACCSTTNPMMTAKEQLFCSQKCYAAYF